MRYLGEVEGKALYAEWNNDFNQVRFILNEDYIAVYDSNIMKLMETPIVFRNNTIENELSAEAKDRIKQLAKEVNVDELQNDVKEYGNDTREAIGKALDIDSEDIKSLTEIDLDEEVEKDETDLNNNIIEQKEKEATTKDIQIKQELKMDTMATSMKTIGGVLERADKMPKVPGKNFTKLGIVESNKIKDIDKDARTNTTRFSIVAIASDGTVVPLELEQDSQEGNNPREISYRVNADGRVEQDDVNSRFKIGNSGETISIKFSNGPGNIEVGYSAHKTLGGEGIEGNVSVDHQLQTSSVYWKSRRDSRDQEYADGVRGTEEKTREAQVESKHDKNWQRGKKGVPMQENDDYKIVDGKLDTDAQNHINDIRQRAKELINEDEDVANVFTEAEVVEMLEKAHDNKKNLDEAEENIKEDAGMLKNHNR